MLFRSAFAVKIVPALATIVIGMLLLFTIYFTLLDWQWIIFLSGVLFAALIALASRASHAEWTIRRRTVQLSQIRERLAQETAAHRNSESAYHLTADKLELLSNALPLMLVYVDAGAHVRALNSAFRIWLGKRTAQVDGLLLATLMVAGSASAADGVAVDRRDDGLRHVADEAVEPVELHPTARARAVVAGLGALLLVAARAERAVARAGQHDGADLAVHPRLLEARHEFVHRLRAERVHALGTVDRDDRDPVLRRVAHVLEAFHGGVS